tara:strand:- start:35 stop:523 length:489 start_codon:yes stop_codon:yes gene_type:complete
MMAEAGGVNVETEIYILYFETTYDGDGVEDRNALCDILEKSSFQWIESTGAQAGFADGDASTFFKICLASGIKLRSLCRTLDPGLGLFNDHGNGDPRVASWHEAGLLVTAKEFLSRERLVKLRRFVMTRSIALFWFGLTSHLYEQGKTGSKRDRAAYEQDFV